MNGTGQIITFSPHDYDAVLFDLDGVLTRTADVHATAWKRLFDDFLKQRADRAGEPFTPFDIEDDYRRYVDGKPRYDGVAAFLDSRAIELPWGSPEDPPDAQTIYGLGRRKDEHFLDELAQHGVEAFDSSIALVRRARELNMYTAVVSSSTNCKAVMEAANIADLFDTRVDGNDLSRLDLKGKPAPDTFLEAARRLGVEPSRALVIEDAVSGVAAGHAGGFCVIGLDRSGHSTALREGGADVVVQDLSQVQLAEELPAPWTLAYAKFDPDREGMREALCALGNGYFTIRGAPCWALADAVHYPGTYLTGGYNRLRTRVAGREVENEDLVNLPNGLSLQFRIGDGEWFNLSAAHILAYRQELDLRRGVLTRRLQVQDPSGSRLVIVEDRFVSMAHMHLAALRLSLTAQNFTGPVQLRSGIDGRVVNAGAQLYLPFNNVHLEPLAGALCEPNGVYLLVRTSQSRLQLAQVAGTRVFLDRTELSLERGRVEEPGYIAEEFTVTLDVGQTLVVEKTLALHSSRDPAIADPLTAAGKSLARAGRFDELLDAHALAWRQLWRRFDVQLQPSAEAPEFALNVHMLLRLNMFHLLQAASPNSIGLDMGVPARGWTGEAYQGHIFWDELFIFPTLNLRAPEITRSLLMYRYRRLDEARAAAHAAGLRGAMFPWQSGSDGQEETQELNLNPRSKRWLPDNTYLQRHVGSAIAWNVWQYYQVTGDEEFMHFYGAELFLDIARFWSSLAIFNEERGRYEIHGVMGPDEFHDAYPDADEPGLNNNAYTNVMAAWVLMRALEVLDMLPGIRRAELRTRLKLSDDELQRWDALSRRMYVPFQADGIISQFEGYEALAELDWDAYHGRYGNIQRLELILEAEGDTANRYKASKQADVLMLFYLFSSEELGALFHRLGYNFEYETIPRNVAYYDSRSSHGSTLSRVVHAWVLARSRRPRAMNYFAEALQSDVSDIQGGTTAEGIHLGAMAGSMDLVQRVTTGIEITHNVLRFNPQLPEALERLDMRIRYRNHTLDLTLTAESLTLHSHEPGAAPIRISVEGRHYTLTGGSTREFPIESRDRLRLQ